MTNIIDNQIKEAYYKVQTKKAEVDAISGRPNWLTNCAFRYGNTDISSTINIQTVTSIDILVEIVGYLKIVEKSITEGLAELELPSRKPTWLGFPIADWLADIKTRINKITLAEKKKELAAMEAKLSKILPPDFEKQLALEELMKSDVFN